MARVKQAIFDVLERLATLEVRNNDGAIVLARPHLWNNQVQHEIEGDSYSFEKPAFFLELLNDVAYEEIGVGYSSADLVFRVHIVTEFYNGPDMEHNLDNYDYRDKVIMLLSGMRPAGCGDMTRISETADYDHPNIYHYLVDFGCNLTDSTGSPYDEAAGKYLTDQTIGGVEVAVELDKNSIAAQRPFMIPKN